MHRAHNLLGTIARLLFATAALLALSTPAFSQGGFDKEEFAARRARLFEQISDGIAVVLAAEEHHQAIKFRQSPDFYYLTGLEEPSAILLLVGPSKQSYVFAHKRSPAQVRFEGPGLRDVEDACALYGLTAVLPMENFLTSLTFIGANAKKLYLQITPPDSAVKGRSEVAAGEINLMRHPLYGFTPPNKTAVARIREIHPQLPVADISPLLDNMRWVKTPYEIKRMRKSGQIGATGMREAIKGTKPGMFEYEIEATLRFVYAKLGAQNGFPPIVASGPNTVVWHYLANSRQMQAGDVVLMDAGSDYEYYFSDITRTWPVSGRFTPEQEKMYRCVLEARAAIIAAIKPGATIKDLKATAAEVYKKHGFLKEFLSLNRYVGHPVGLSVHDVDPSVPGRPFEPGVVFNVEPILEFGDKKIHVRLEDTILVTQTGAENLTSGAPAGIEELYALIEQKGIRMN